MHILIFLENQNILSVFTPQDELPAIRPVIPAEWERFGRIAMVCVGSPAAVAWDPSVPKRSVRMDQENGSGRTEHQRPLDRLSRVLDHEPVRIFGVLTYFLAIAVDERMAKREDRTLRVLGERRENIRLHFTVKLQADEEDRPLRELLTDILDMAENPLLLRLLTVVEPAVEPAKTIHEVALVQRNYRKSVCHILLPSVHLSGTERWLHTASVAASNTPPNARRYHRYWERTASQ